MFLSRVEWFFPLFTSWWMCNRCNLANPSSAPVATILLSFWSDLSWCFPKDSDSAIGLTCMP